MKPLIPQTSLTEINQANEPQINVPVRLLLDLNNALHPEDQLRTTVIEHIKNFANKHNWSRAILKDDSGNLFLDEHLRKLAINRGKQETYFKKAEELFSELSNALKQIESYQQLETQTVMSYSQDENKNQPILPMRELNEKLAYIKQHTNELNRLNDLLANGLTNVLAGTVDTQEDFDQAALDTSEAMKRAETEISSFEDPTQLSKKKPG